MNARREHGALLQAVVLGEVDVHDPRVQRAIAVDPEFARSLDEMLGLQRTLDAAGKLEAEHLRAAERAAAPAFDAGALVRDLAAARPKRALRARWLVAAAALIVAAGVVLWLRGDGDAAPRPINAVLGEEVRDLELARDGDRYRLTWRANLASGDYHAVVVRDLAGSELLRSDDVHEPAWIFPAAAAATWPPRLVIEVGTYDLDRNLRRTAHATLALPR